MRLLSEILADVSVSVARADFDTHRRMIEQYRELSNLEEMQIGSNTVSALSLIPNEQMAQKKLTARFKCAVTCRNSNFKHRKMSGSAQATGTAGMPILGEVNASLEGELISQSRNQRTTDTVAIAEIEMEFCKQPLPECFSMLREYANEQLRADIHAKLNNKP